MLYSYLGGGREEGGGLLTATLQSGSFIYRSKVKGHPEPVRGAAGASGSFEKEP